MVWHLPTELLHDLKGDCFCAFQKEGIPVVRGVIGSFRRFEDCLRRRSAIPFNQF